VAGLLLAAAGSVGGFLLLSRAAGRESGSFLAWLLGVFLGRVALVASVGLTLYALAPAHLALGLVSLVGFHFLFAVIEVALLARNGLDTRRSGEGARTG
jgi:hypothetical protein